MLVPRAVVAVAALAFVAAAWPILWWLDGGRR